MEKGCIPFLKCTKILCDHLHEVLKHHNLLCVLPVFQPISIYVVNVRSIKPIFPLLLRQRPYHVEYTGSRPITEVKQRWARLVLGWVTAWEHRVLLALFFSLIIECHTHTLDMKMY